MTDSRFLNFAASTARFFAASFENSKSAVLLKKAISFVLSAFSGSFLLGIIKRFPALYPARLWNALDAANARIKFDIFNPIFIFPVAYLSFVVIGSYRISNLAFVSVLIGVLFFAIGVKASNRVSFGKMYLENRSAELAAALLTIGILSLIYDVYQTGSIPLLDPLARKRLNVIFTMLASLAVPGEILAVSIIGQRFRRGGMCAGDARIYTLLTVLAVTGLMALLGYRTQIIVSLLGAAVAAYCWRIFGAAEISLAFFVTLLSISALGYYRALAEDSTVGFSDVIGRRIGLTLSVYDNLINRFWLFGANRGSVLLATFSSFLHFIPGPRLGPRTIVAGVFGVQGISMTSTLLGTVVLDFGIPGIVFFMFSLGAVIGMAYKAAKQLESALAASIFSLLIAYALVGIETGLVDFNVAMFFIVSFLMLLNSRK